MTRTEARTSLSVALACLVVGLAWLFGPYGLLGFGLLVLVVVLFVVDVEGTGQNEAVADPAAPGRRDRPVQRQ